MAKKKTIAGGSATGGGINFQAAVTAVIETHIAAGAKLDWFIGIANDIPIVVSAETGGPGDDIGTVFSNGSIAEFQVKKGLSSSPALWESLLKLAAAIDDKSIDYGALVVCPNSSGTIRNELARDLERIAGGRLDGLKDISNKFLDELKTRGLPAQATASRLRIVTATCLVADSALVKAAKALLRPLCSKPQDADRAWDALYLDAAQLIEFRGARSADRIFQVLGSSGVKLTTDKDAPISLLSGLRAWTIDSTNFISIPSVPKPLPIKEAWIEIEALVADDDLYEPIGLADALATYHNETLGIRKNRETVSAETIGRFMRQAVIIGGPGMGKSTLLKKLANTYATEGFPVLRVSANLIAQRMKTLGSSFEESLVALGTDGSGLPISVGSLNLVKQWIVLCDAIDEAGDSQGLICDGLIKFSIGHPSSAIVATTRPIGYRTSLLQHWRHYVLQPLEANSALKHIERLIRVVLSDEEAKSRAVFNAKRQIEENASAKIAARNPLLLGLMSALVMQQIPLGTTRVQLYERLFVQMETAHRAPESEDLSHSVLSTFLDIVAWQLLHQSTATVPDLLIACGRILANALSEPLLKTRTLAERCFLHWERAGMIERVRHAGVEVATFIHKTFAEYAAARYLAELPESEAAHAIQENIENEDWAEVLIFSSSLGRANQVLSAIVASRKELTLKETIRALDVLTHSETQPSVQLRETVFCSATLYLASPIAREAMVIGNRLLDVGNVYPQEVGILGRAHISNDQAWTRVAAWAAATFSPKSFATDAELKEFIAHLPSLSAVEAVRRHDVFDFSASPGRQIDRIYQFAARETLDSLPEMEADVLLLPILLAEYPGTVGGQMALLDLFQQRGRKKLCEAVTRKTTKLWADTIGDFDSGAIDEIRLFIDALSFQLDEPIEIDNQKPPLWQLSGLLKSIDFWELAIRDIWPTRSEIDDFGIQETLKGSIAASGVDRALLSREVTYLLEQTKTSGSTLNTLALHTKRVDVALDWKRANGLDVDRLEGALHLTSAWFVQAAANLLLTNATHEELTTITERVLASGKGNALWAASQLALFLGEPTASRLLLDRLEKAPKPGFEHLYTALAHLKPHLDKRLLDILEAGLLKHDAKTSTAAAKTARLYGGVRELQTLLQDSFDLWIEKEAPYPIHGGIVPDSPRDRLLEALLQSDDFDRKRLFRYASDVRSDVRKVASEALNIALKEQEGLAEEFLAAIETGVAAPKLLTSALESGIPFTRTQVLIICSFLRHPLPQLKRAAMPVLTERYITKNDLLDWAGALAGDVDPEVRELARRLGAAAP